MPARVANLAGALLVLTLLAAPLAVHVVLVTHRGQILATVLVALQAALIAWVASSSITRRMTRAGACGLVFGGVLSLSRFMNGGLLAAAAVPHGMTYLALLALFATSLGRRREAVVTMLARRSRGHLSPDVVRYTRRVTWAWCGFFVAQLVASCLLLLFAPPVVWSWFINLCNLPLIGVMFGAEYIYRQWRHAARPPERLVDTLRIFRQIRAMPINEDP
jgi:uncharacterized membrane protein